MSMQNFERLYTYIHDYQQLVYDYYSRTGVAFLINYYNINIDNTVWDNEYMMGGAYQHLGDLTGVKFNKYLLLPVYFIDEIATAFDGQETGYNKMTETSFVIPSSYGLTPYPGDLVKLEQAYLRPTNNTYPLYTVEGVEVHPNTDKRFWKLKIKPHHSSDIHEADHQVTNTFVFFDYDKKIHTLDDATTLAKMLYKNEQLQERLENLWDPNTGFFQV